MPDTYCGKSCAQCAYKEELSCSGCKAGPGHESQGDCAIARCCRGSRRESCGSCSAGGRCASLQSMHRIPRNRIFHRAADAEKQAKDLSRARELSKLLRVVFWLEIVICIVSLLTADLVIDYVPILYRPGKTLEHMFRLVTGLILLKMSSGDTGYRTAGLCAIAAVMAYSVALILSEAILPNFLFTIISFILLLICENRAFSAHAGILAGIDDTLSEKWENLWKWRLIVYVSMIGSAALRSFSGFHPTLTTLIKTVSLSALVMVYIFRIMELWGKGGKHHTAGNTIFGAAETSPQENHRVSWRWLRLEYFAAIFVIILMAVFGILSVLTWLITLATSILMPLFLWKTIKNLQKYTTT